MKLSTHLFYLAAALFAGQVMSTPVAAAAAEAEAGDVLNHDSIQARSICHGKICNKWGLGGCCHDSTCQNNRCT
ncbi:unnamed protein product [Zymoseptoria tritici ST99CH_3D1]|nr:unnamed protein product [Zymoseptoria tritici ST99CH_3D1]